MRKLRRRLGSLASFDPKHEYLPTIVLMLTLLTVTYCWSVYTYSNVETQSKGRLVHHAWAISEYLYEYTSAYHTAHL